MALKTNFTIALIGAVLALLNKPTAVAGEIVINAVGDIMLAGSAAPVLKRFGYDYPFAATAAELKNGDIAIGNLESPLAGSGIEFVGKRYRFRAAPETALALKNAGFSVMTLANNHMMDFGGAALRETLLNLDRYGILHSGAGDTTASARQAALVNVKGSSIAFLAYSLTLPQEFYAASDRPGTAPGYPAYFKQDIALAKGAADYVVVSFHWGLEGATSIRPYQVAVAHAAIDAGADVVLGHHPHVLQGIERYKKGIIMYSLGNFAFGSRSRSSARSMIARIRLEKGVKGVEIVPLNVLNSEVGFQPRHLKGKEGEKVVRQLNRLSRAMGTVIVCEGDRFLMRTERGNRMVARRERQQYVPTIRGD